MTLDIPLLAIALVSLPLGGAALCFMLAGMARIAGQATAVLTLCVALLLTFEVSFDGHAGPVRYLLGGWDTPLGIALRIDSLAVLMIVMTALVATAAAFATGRSTLGQSPLFWPLWLGLWSGLNALFLAGDLFNIFVTLELVGLASVALAGLAAKRAAIEAALRYLFVNLIGSLCYLMGVALIYRAYGVLDIAMLSAVIQPTMITLVACALTLAGLLLKTAIFPLHFWLPPAHANAPAVVSAVLSGLVVKASFYLLLRIWLDLMGGIAPAAVPDLLAALGAAAIIWGSIQALRAPRLKMLVAYSTVAQLGYLLLAFGLIGPSSDPAVIAAVVVFALAHAFAKAAMFLASGVMLTRLGHDRIDDFAGTSIACGSALFAFALAAISIVGLPPSGGFIAKWLLLTSALEARAWLVALVLVAGSLMAAAYVLRPLAAALLVRDTDAPVQRDRRHADTTAWPALSLALASLFIGFLSEPILAALTDDGLALTLAALKVTP